jgi:maintenance of morphology protein 1
MAYKDNVSISVSTAYLFNYPTIGFARLPVSVTISLSVFACRVSRPYVLPVSPSQPLQVVITPPSYSSPIPALTLTMLPEFTLDLKSTSLLGSRAKLADVPKLHELIDSQLRHAIKRRRTLKIALPGLSSNSVEDAKVAF